MNKEITYEEYCNALQKSWEVPLDVNACFPQQISVWVTKKCSELGVPFPYVAYPLITSVAYSLGVSVVEVSKRYKEPVIIYSLVSGRSGTNKTGSLCTIQVMMDSLTEIDRRQHVYDSGTMEGLMATLSENDGSVLCAVDEFSTFLDSMDKNSNGQAERSRYLSLWSGSNWSKKTKHGGLVEIKNPRFNFTGFNQNYFLINLILKGNNYDGFLPRFLLATPDEVFVKLGVKITSSDEDDNVNMYMLMKTIYNKFRNGCIFKLSEKALEYFTVYHDDEVLVQRMNDRFDDVKSSVLSKSISNVLRVAAIQCALRYAVNSTQEHENNESESAEDVVDVDDIEENKKLIMNISAEDMKSSMHIVRYSVQCVCTLIDSTKSHVKQKSILKTGMKRSSFDTMPESHAIDKEFLFLHRSKIQKLYNIQNTSGSNKVLFSKITKDHLYPQISGSKGSDVAKKFLVGLELNGLGKYVEDGQKYFKMLDLNDAENISEDTLKLLGELGIKNI